jgi:hypothetical protein
MKGSSVGDCGQAVGADFLVILNHAMVLPMPFPTSYPAKVTRYFAIAVQVGINPETRGLVLTNPASAMIDNRAENTSAIVARSW